MLNFKFKSSEKDQCSFTWDQETKMLLVTLSADDGLIAVITHEGTRNVITKFKLKNKATLYFLGVEM